MSPLLECRLVFQDTLLGIFIPAIIRQDVLHPLLEQALAIKAVKVVEILTLCAPHIIAFHTDLTCNLALRCRQHALHAIFNDINLDVFGNLTNGRALRILQGKCNGTSVAAFQSLALGIRVNHLVYISLEQEMHFLVVNIQRQRTAGSSQDDLHLIERMQFSGLCIAAHVKDHVVEVEVSFLTDRQVLSNHTDLLPIIFILIINVGSAISASYLKDDIIEVEVYPVLKTDIALLADAEDSGMRRLFLPFPSCHWPIFELWIAVFNLPSA